MVPQLDLGKISMLEAAAAKLTSVAGQVQTTGADVHATFQGISADYDAPEAGRLLNSTQPVKTQAGVFGHDVTGAGSALATFAEELRPIAIRLQILRAEAMADPANPDVMAEIDMTMAQLRAAEQKAAAAIQASSTSPPSLTELAGGEMVLPNGMRFPMPPMAPLPKMPALPSRFTWAPASNPLPPGARIQGGQVVLPNGKIMGPAPSAPAQLPPGTKDIMGITRLPNGQVMIREKAIISRAAFFNPEFGGLGGGVAVTSDPSHQYPGYLTLFGGIGWGGVVNFGTTTQPTSGFGVGARSVQGPVTLYMEHDMYNRTTTTIATADFLDGVVPKMGMSYGFSLTSPSDREELAKALASGATLPGVVTDRNSAWFSLGAEQSVFAWVRFPMPNSLAPRQPLDEQTSDLLVEMMNTPPPTGGVSVDDFTSIPTPSNGFITRQEDLSESLSKLPPYTGGPSFEKLQTMVPLSDPSAAPSSKK